MNFKSLEVLMEKLSGEKREGMSISVSLDGNEVFRRHVGLIDATNSVDDNTIFRMFSMTKIITCVCALKLLENGAFSLSTPLYKYLPEFKNMSVFMKNKEGSICTKAADNPILIKDLFSMTTGYNYPNNPSENGNAMKDLISLHLSQREPSLTFREYLKTIAQFPLDFEPGSKWQYGINHDILGALITVISGKSLGLFMKENVFDPLGMKNTSFGISDADKKHLCKCTCDGANAELCMEINNKSVVRPPIISAKGENALFESGGAGLFSTLDDYVLFGKMLQSGGTLNGEKILSQQTLDLMATNALSGDLNVESIFPHLRGYGYGLGVRVLLDGKKARSPSSIGEFGWDGMLGTYILIDRVKKLSVVFMQQKLPTEVAARTRRLKNAIYKEI